MMKRATEDSSIIETETAEVIESNINSYLNSFLKNPEKVSSGQRQFCCGTSRSIYCPECFRLLLDKDQDSLEYFSKVKLPFSVDIILTDRRVASTGVHSVVLADPVRLIDCTREDDIPTYDEEGTFILFPAAESIPLSSVAEKIKKLVVLDCKWTKSSIRMHPNLVQVQKVHLSNPPLQSQFWRWHNAGASMLSTIEAIYVSVFEVASKLRWHNDNMYDLLKLLYIFGITRAETAKSSFEKNKVCPFDDSDKNRRREKLSYKGSEKHKRDKEKGRSLKFQHSIHLKNKEIMKISVWIVPVAYQFDVLHKQIIEITSRQNLPSFIPHVTLLGGIPCANKSEANDVVKLLKRHLKSFGDIEVEFSGSVTCARDKATNEVKWNQSCLISIKRNLKFVRISHIVREIVEHRKNMASIPSFKFNDDVSVDVNSLTFPEPFGEPHYSFAYGNDESLCPKIRLISSGFTSREVVVWITSPASLEGVKSWRFFASIPLD